MAEDFKDVLVFNEALGLFICRDSNGSSCGVGFLKFKTLHNHLKTVHGFEGTQSELPQWIKDKVHLMAQSYEDPKLDPFLHPTCRLPPVEHVTVEKGFACFKCFKGFKSDGTFRNHLGASESGCVKSNMGTSDIQKLFNGQRDSYFAIQEFPQLSSTDQQLLDKLSQLSTVVQQSCNTRRDSTTSGWINEVSEMGLENSVLLTILPTEPFAAHSLIVAPLKATIEDWITKCFNELYPILSDFTKMALCSGKVG
jgi:hypothetical protein